APHLLDVLREGDQKVTEAFVRTDEHKPKWRDGAGIHRCQGRLTEAADVRAAELSNTLHVHREAPAPIQSPRRRRRRTWPWISRSRLADAALFSDGFGRLRLSHRHRRSDRRGHRRKRIKRLRHAETIHELCCSEERPRRLPVAPATANVPWITI